MMTDTLTIAVPPDGQLVECKGQKITADLAIVELPEEGYSVTHIHTGRALAYFAYPDLAMKCLQELEPLMDWSGQEVEAVQALLKPSLRVILAVRDKWEQVDDERYDADEAADGQRQ